MVRLRYAYYLVMQVLVTFIAVYNVLVVSGPTILFYLENEVEKSLIYHIILSSLSLAVSTTGVVHVLYVCVCVQTHVCSS